MIDTNVYLSRYPFRRLYGDEPSELLSTLRKNGIAQAWASSFDALLHRDLAAVNARLAEDCRRYSNGDLLPIGSVNPTAPDWREDLRRCIAEHRMQGLRLHPAYHGYGLDHPSLAELFGLAAERNIFLQIVCTMEDERTQHPLVKAAPVALDPLPGALRRAPNLRVQLLNCRGGSPELLTALALTQRAYSDFAMIEGVHGPARWNAALGSDRVVFGSYSPFFYCEAAVLKVKEAGMDSKTLDQNAKRLLGAKR
ncbi:MAG: amidohydrolase family protein [Bryobacteraceae bacterium]